MSIRKSWPDGIFVRDDDRPACGWKIERKKGIFGGGENGAFVASV